MNKDIINKLPQATPTLEGEDAIRFLKEMDKEMEREMRKSTMLKKSKIVIRNNKILAKRFGDYIYTQLCVASHICPECGGKFSYPMWDDANGLLGFCDDCGLKMEDCSIFKDIIEKEVIE